jgi:divalent metal cation (Fe/Co/Zn/Cd) transporter
MKLFLMVFLSLIISIAGFGTFWQLKNYLTDEGKRNPLFMFWLVVLHIGWAFNLILALLKIIYKI